MRTLLQCWCSLAASTILWLAILPVTAQAEDFGIYSKIYVGKDVVENVTLFRAGRVYDFSLSAPEEITVFDPPGHKFVVMDVERQMKTDVTMTHIDQFAQKVKAEALARPVPLLAFLAEPKFEETFDETTGDLSLTSEWMDYHVKTVKPKLLDAVSQFSEFSNWQTKLNTLLRPGSFPPFARLELNQALDRRQRLPVEVRLTRYAQHPTKRQINIRAEHRLQWRLLESDLKRIDEAAAHLATFQSVGLAEYQRPALAETATAADRR